MPVTYAPVFTSNGRTYDTGPNEGIGTITFMFRKDLDWDRFTKYAVQHFKDKEKVNFVQFACSDGSEAYSQIITLLENHPEDAEKFFPIRAYDIDDVIIDAAQSGNVNLCPSDIIEMGDNIFEKYFKKAKKEMIIDNDSMPYTIFGNHSMISLSTYEVSPELTKRVQFEKQDMYYKLYQLKDNSNTIVMCRNCLGYMNNKEIDFYTDLLSKRLKKDSLFVIGALDVNQTNIEGYLMRKGFIRVMTNVYQKI